MQSVQIIDPALAQIEPGTQKNLPGHGLQGQGLGPGEHQRRFPLGQLPQQGQPLLLPAPGDPRRTQEGQLPGGQHRRPFGQKSGQLVCHPGSSGVVGADHAQRPVQVLKHGGQEQGPVGIAQAGQTDGASGSGKLQQGLVFGHFAQGAEKKVHGGSFLWDGIRRRMMGQKSPRCGKIRKNAPTGNGRGAAAPLLNVRVKNNMMEPGGAWHAPAWPISCH